MKKLVLLTGALLVSTAASAQAPSGTQSDSAEADNPNQRICRTVADLGTRLSRSRICRTRAEWEAMRRETRGQVDRSQTTRVHRSDQ